MSIGGGAPITVQAMTKTDTRDVAATLAQVRQVTALGCDLVRLAVPDTAAAQALADLRPHVEVPLVADIHFDHRLALAALEAGVDKLRLNPGNIGGSGQVRQVARAARDRGVPIRVGANAGSLPRDLLRRHGGPTPEALCEAALIQVDQLRRAGMEDIVVSVKASSVEATVAAYRLVAARCDLPLHLGLTEAGPLVSGLVKSTVALGRLLSEGIGDTLRISLTAPPETEVRAGIALLREMGLKARGVDIISCPTCGRCQVDLPPLVAQLERATLEVRRPLKVAVMGCPVNGPGEAREADVGIACGPRQAVLFRRGKVVGRLDPEHALKAVLEEIERLEKE